MGITFLTTPEDTEHIDDEDESSSEEVNIFIKGIEKEGFENFPLEWVSLTESIKFEVMSNMFRSLNALGFI